MTSQRRQPHRRQDGRAPAFTGDFTDDGRDITEITGRPADWDGSTYTWGGASNVGLPDGGTPRVVNPAEDYRQAIARANAETRTEPIARPRPAPPAAILTGRQAPWVMTVNPPRPGDPGPTPEALDVVRYLRAKVAILRHRGHLDRISDEKLAMLPAMRQTNRRTTALLIVDEATELLRCGGGPQ